MTRKKQPAARMASVEVTTLLRVNDGDTFYCNINSFQPLFGNNIGVRVRGIDCAEMTAAGDPIDFRAVEAKHLTNNSLFNAKQIILKNITRGKYFRLIADVYFDGQNLAALLLSKKLARKY